MAKRENLSSEQRVWTVLECGDAFRAEAASEVE